MAEQATTILHVQNEFGLFHVEFLACMQMNGIAHYNTFGRYTMYVMHWNCDYGGEWQGIGSHGKKQITNESVLQEIGVERELFKTGAAPTHFFRLQKIFTKLS